MRLSGCPSLTLKMPDDPLRDDPVAYIDQTCVGCGNCGEVADAAVLCPSFYRADLVHNPARWSGGSAGHKRKVIGWLQAAARAASNSSDLRRRHEQMTEASNPRPRRRLDQIVKLAIMAVGGQGGGVLTNWIEALAAQSQRLCRAGDRWRAWRSAPAPRSTTSRWLPGGRCPAGLLAGAGRRRCRHPDRRRDDGGRAAPSCAASSPPTARR
jgi:hypothetical protein